MNCPKCGKYVEVSYPGGLCTDCGAQQVDKYLKNELGRRI